MATTKRVQTTIEYKQSDFQPPLYIAGSFSDPQWQPQEMQCSANDHKFDFTAHIEVDEGKHYEYKFRVGPGDWWVLDEGGVVVTDNDGNRNNLLVVPVTEIKTTTIQERVQPPNFLTLADKESAVVNTVEVDSMSSPVLETPVVAKEDAKSEVEKSTSNTYLRQFDESVADDSPTTNTTTQLEDESSGKSTQEPAGLLDKTYVDDKTTHAGGELDTKEPASVSSDTNSAGDEEAVSVTNPGAQPTEEREAETQSFVSPEHGSSGNSTQIVIEDDLKVRPPPKLEDQQIKPELAESQHHNVTPIEVENTQEAPQPVSSPASSSAENLGHTKEAIVVSPSRRQEGSAASSQDGSRSSSPGRNFSKTYLSRVRRKDKDSGDAGANTAGSVNEKSWLDDSSDSQTQESQLTTDSTIPRRPQHVEKSERASSANEQLDRSIKPHFKNQWDRKESVTIPYHMDMRLPPNERVFPTPIVEGSSKSSEIIKKDAQIPRKPVVVSPESDNLAFHLNWSPLDWDLEAKKKYEPQRPRLEEIRRLSNHMYDQEKDTHRSLLNSKRGKVLHTLYNTHHAQKATISKVTKDMWTYIKFIREEKRLKSSRGLDTVPLTWVFHVDEPHHPHYTLLALEEHIDNLQNEILFYGYREKIESGAPENDENTWYSPTTFDFLDEESASEDPTKLNFHGRLKKKYRKRKSDKEDEPISWEQKRVQIINSKGDIFSEKENLQLDLLSGIDDFGISTENALNVIGGSKPPVAEKASVTKRFSLSKHFMTRNEQAKLPPKKSEAKEEVVAHGQPVEPSNITPFFVGNRQLGDDLREIPTDGEGPHITVQPATPAPVSSSKAKDSKQLGHIVSNSDDSDSASQLTVQDKRHSKLGDRPVTPSSIHTADPESKKTVFQTFLRFIFVEFWRSLFSKISKIGRAPSNV